MKAYGTHLSGIEFSRDFRFSEELNDAEEPRGVLWSSCQASPLIICQLWPFSVIRQKTVKQETLDAIQRLNRHTHRETVNKQEHNKT